MENKPAPLPPPPKFHHTHHHFYMVVFIVWALAAALFISAVWGVAIADMETMTPEVVVPETAPIGRDKPLAQTVKGIYLTASSANSAEKLDSIIKLIDETELNAVVIDIKDYTGYVLYDSQVPLVKKLKTSKTVIDDVPAVIKKLHEHNIYTIARQTVFQDPVLAEAKPEWAITNKKGGVWHDDKGLSWVDATREEVWKYNVAIAAEAIALGFDEINFDYVRFPSDGNMSLVKYNTSEARYKTMGKFYTYLGEELKDEPAWISVDFFGLTMDAKGTNDLGIGQRLVDAVDNVDYICPMMYPSHYGAGYAGLENPAANPAKVFKTGLKKGMPAFKDKRAKVRPWIQAFNIGAVYDENKFDNKIRAQIDEIEKVSDSGWLMWNAANRYSDAGLKPK